MWKKVRFVNMEVARALYNMKRAEGLCPVWTREPYMYAVSWREKEQADPVMGEGGFQQPGAVTGRMVRQ